MTGVVLCGGKSTRMGSDKGLLQKQSVAWAELTANKLLDLKLPVALSVNEEQYALYSAKFTSLKIVKDNTALDVYGPLKGILSVHGMQPGEDLLVLACDMPAMQTEVIDHLMKTSSVKEEEAFVFKNDLNTETLCAIYTSRGLKKIYDLCKEGQLKRHSLYYVLQNIDTHYLPLPDKWKKYFNNYNLPDDLNHL